MKRKHLSLCAVALCAASMATAQTIAETDSFVNVPRIYKGDSVVVKRANTDRFSNNWFSKIRLTGAIQSEFLIPQDDAKINTPEYAGDVLNNTYFDLTLNAPYLSLGGRFQFTKWPLPGFEDDFANWGVPYFWATAHYKWAQLTVGDFYQQFGSGLILRTYEERSLGIDNALRGGRVVLTPFDGVKFTALGGKPRHYWDHNTSWLWGADVEWALNESFRDKFNKKIGVSLGFSYVGRHEGDDDIFTEDMSHKLNLPNTIAAFDARVKLRLHDFNVLAEFATKNNDPNSINNFIYRRGNVILLSATYAKKGFSAFIQAKRSDNMSFRSRRSMTGNSWNINHMPAFTFTQTYALAAMYPYATQPDGEWAFQGEVRYNIKRGTPLGGKYGTQLRLTGSYITGLDNDNITLDKIIGTNGVGRAFWKMGGLRYTDLNFEINKKFNKNLQFTLFYMYQRYNQKVVEGHGTNGDIVNSNIFVLEGQWKMSKKAQLRWELQYLQTKQDLGDWVAGVVELSLAPHWMFTFTDMWNVGVTNLNYYNAQVTYNLKANRFQLGYGRTRAGYNCSGGVCRWIPASKGFTLTYNYTF